MTEWNEYYMRSLKHSPKPIKELKCNDTYWYFLGSALAFVFWVWFIIWFTRY